MNATKQFIANRREAITGTLCAIAASALIATAFCWSKPASASSGLSCDLLQISISANADLFLWYRDKYLQSGSADDKYEMEKHRFDARRNIRNAQAKGCVIPPLPPGIR